MRSDIAKGFKDALDRVDQREAERRSRPVLAELRHSRNELWVNIKFREDLGRAIARPSANGAEVRADLLRLLIEALIEAYESGANVGLFKKGEP